MIFYFPRSLDTYIIYIYISTDPQIDAARTSAKPFFDKQKAAPPGPKATPKANGKKPASKTAKK